MFQQEINISDTENPLDETSFGLLKVNLHNSSGIAYVDFKKTLSPDYKKVWLDISNGWILLFLIMVLEAFVLPLVKTGSSLLISLLAAIAAGYMIAYLVNFFHEAAHYNIAKNRKTNDRLANIFIGILTGQGIKNYRLVHWQHHLNLGLPEDTERSYFESLGWKFLATSLTGISALTFFLRRNKFVTTAKKNDDRSLKKEKISQLLWGVFFHGLLLSFLYWMKQYWLMASWVLAIGCFYPFFNRLRQLIEHRSDQASKKNDYTKTPHGKLTRLFGNNIVDRSFGSAGFNKHLLHHLEPSVSYTRLNDLENFLKESPIGNYIKKNKTSYYRSFKKLLNK